MSTFRRIAAACALFAVMAMGLTAPAEAGAQGAAATSAGGLDATLGVAAARRARGAVTDRGGGDELDGQSHGHHGGLFHALWLAASSSFPPPAFSYAGTLASAVWRAPATPLLDSRTSRGPPARS